MTNDPTPTTSSATERTMFPPSAVRALVAMLVCLSLWVVLAAPRLQRAAEASPDGRRRDAALSLLDPLVRFEDSTGFSTATGNVEAALGHDPDAAAGGELDIDALLDNVDLPPLPTPSQVAAPSPTPDKKHAKQKGPKEPRDDKLRRPTERYKLRIAVVGDSLAQGIGQSIERSTRGSLVHVLNLGRIATGLARSDYFDWVNAMEKVARRYTPDVVVVMMGGNDKQGIILPSGRVVASGDPDWGATYRKRIADLLAAAKARTHVVWIGLPPVKDKGKSRLFREYNARYASVTEDRRNGAFLDIWERFADEDGGYKPYGRGPAGNIELLRAGDGSHFTAAGYDIVVEKVLLLMRDRWDLDRRTLR